MTDMTDAQRKELRRQIGHAMLGIQANNMRYGPDVLMPEIVAALVSLAAFVARTIVIDRDAFEELCEITTEFEWARDPDDKMSWLQ